MDFKQLVKGCSMADQASRTVAKHKSKIDLDVIELHSRIP